GVSMQINPCHSTFTYHSSGTHDIQNISVFSSLPGTIVVTGDFIQGSNATGVLVIVYSFTNKSNVHYISDDTKENIDIRITDLSGAVYSISIYALEGGLPFPRAVCLPKIINIDNDNNQGL
ncbi:MAG: hypothetical protein MJE68_12335, partial [Proteobacteria bacterium]|nr:hypothetical protein [Pseudomonadota bacterium]